VGCSFTREEEVRSEEEEEEATAVLFGREPEASASRVEPPIEESPSPYPLPSRERGEEATEEHPHPTLSHRGRGVKTPAGNIPNRAQPFRNVPGRSLLPIAYSLLPVACLEKRSESFRAFPQFSEFFRGFPRRERRETMLTPCGTVGCGEKWVEKAGGYHRPVRRSSTMGSGHIALAYGSAMGSGRIIYCGSAPA
jgi:hypothetical protein